MRLTAAAVVATCAAVPLMTGCATTPGGKPDLTKRAFARATRACHVVSQGVGHVRGSGMAYGTYLISDMQGRARSDDGVSRACLTQRLAGYHYDFLGEAMADR